MIVFKCTDTWGVTIDTDWWTPIINFINEQMLPPEIEAIGTEATKIMRSSNNYILIDDKLHKRGVGTRILMKCISTKEGKDILQEIHDGSCGNRAASRTLVGKAFRSGSYWPTALVDAENLVRRCPGCQYFAKQIHLPAHNLITIPPS